MKAAPIWPGHPMTALWSIPDPKRAEGKEAEMHLAFAEAFRMVSNRISVFLSLPMETLDRMALQHHLDEIGRGEDRDQTKAS
jgi:arsenate reductase (thioredoxin)